jgi:hypothetical protein
MNNLLRPRIWPSFLASSAVGSCDVPFRYGSEPIPRQRGTVARWHAHLCGLATAIHETSGLGSQQAASSWQLSVATWGKAVCALRLFRFGKKDGQNLRWLALVTFNHMRYGRVVVDCIARREYLPMLADYNLHFTLQHVNEFLSFMG